MSAEPGQGWLGRVRSGPVRQQLRLLAVSLGVYAVAAGFWVVVLGHPNRLAVTPDLAWWILPIFCVVGAYLQIELHDYRISSTVSLQDIPLILSLFLYRPDVALASYLIGGLISRSVRRRGVAIAKEIFNASQEATVCGVAFVVFRAFQPDPVHLFAARNILAAAVAAVAIWLVEEICFTVGYSAMLGRLEMAISGTLSGMVTVTVNLSMALVAMVFVVYEPAMSLSMVPPVLLMVWAQRQATAHRQRAARMEFLYTTNELLHSTSDAVGSALGLLGEIIPMFHVGRVELIVAPPNGAAVRLIATEGGDAIREPHTLDELEADLLGGLPTNGGAVDATSGSTSPLTPLLAARGVATGMAARVSGLGSDGMLLLLGSTGAQGRFGAEDPTLLATLAAQVRSALERGDLSRALESAAEERKELTQKALHDPLTRLANRTLFNDRVAAAAAASGPESMYSAVLFIDLDDFKLVNDTYGHAAGDEVLLEVAERLRSISRPTDVASRFGGDEFGVLLSSMQTAGNAATTAQRVVTSLGEPVTITGGEVRVRASVGVAIVGGSMPTCDAAELLRRADAAMYVSKRSGKGQFTVYDPGAEALFSQAEKEGVALRAALERDQLKVIFHPIVSMRTNGIVGVQAALRWQHPTRGLLAPDGFMAVAEGAGLVAAIGLNVVGQVAEQLAQWSSATTEDTWVFVPVFAKHLLQPRFVDETLALVNQAGIAPSSLVLTLDQALAVERSDEIGPRLRQISAAGFRIAVEGFGRGGDIPLGLLKTFPISSIHLSEDLTRDLQPGGGTDNEIVSGVMRVAALLGVIVVARGIDTKAQLTVLRDLDCGFAQGAALGESVDPASFESIAPPGSATTPRFQGSEARVRPRSGGA